MESAPAKSLSPLEERARILRYGSLRPVHFIALACLFGLTLAVWQYSAHQIQARNEALFARSSDRFVAQLTDRLTKYEDALWSGVALINATRGQIDRSSWRSFVDDLKVVEKYPGVNGFGVIYRVEDQNLAQFVQRERRSEPGFTPHPDMPPGTHMIITYIEPQSVNAKAVGLDITFEEFRREAMQNAGKTGTAQITGPIVLVQDAENTPGFLFYAPFYHRDPDGKDRRDDAHFAGAVYAPFIAKKLMAGVLDEGQRWVRISISDGQDMLYDEHDVKDPGNDIQPLMQRKVSLNAYGRTWTLDIRSNSDFRKNSAQWQPTVILLLGLVIDLMLLAMFILVTRSNRRAVCLADRLTEDLKAEKTRLEASNAALERYAYASSHDLKTPLRGLRDLADYLAEDLQTDFPEAHADPKIRESITDIRGLIDRMNGLVRGILEYSMVGSQEVGLKEINTAEVIAGLAKDLSLDEPHFLMTGAFPKIRFNDVAFAQIVDNLLGNAIKHHDAPEDMKIQVQGRSDGKDFILSVIDNGPGIDPKFREKIFEMFQVLYPSRSRNSTGIGLAIVRRCLETCGGSVSVGTAPDGGAEFVVTLPAVVIEPWTEEAAA